MMSQMPSSWCDIVWEAWGHKMLGSCDRLQLRIEMFVYYAFFFFSDSSTPVLLRSIFFRIPSLLLSTRHKKTKTGGYSKKANKIQCLRLTSKAWHCIDFSSSLFCFSNFQWSFHFQMNIDFSVLFCFPLLIILKKIILGISIKCKFGVNG